MIYGEWGSLKSFLAYSMALSVATGTPWLGRYPATARRVLYVDEENPRDVLHSRNNRLRAGMGIGPGVEGVELAFLHFAGVLMNSEGAPKLLAHLQASSYLPHVIHFDALRRILVGSENEQEYITAFWRNLLPITRLGISTCIVHHMHKPPAGSGGRESLRTRYSGHNDIMSGADAGFAVERLEGSRTLARVTAVKARRGREVPPFVVELTGDGDEPLVLRVVEGVGGSPTPGPEVFRTPL